MDLVEPAGTSYTGLSQEQSNGLGLLGAVHPDDREGAMLAWERAAAGDHLDIECRMFHALEGRPRHLRTRATAVRKFGSDETEWIGTSTDVDDLVQLQAQQAVLVAELQHRTRNLIAVVQPVTLRTLKGTRPLRTFTQASLTGSVRWAAFRGCSRTAPTACG